MAEGESVVKAQLYLPSEGHFLAANKIIGDGAPGISCVYDVSLRKVVLRGPFYSLFNHCCKETVFGYSIGQWLMEYKSISPFWKVIWQHVTKKPSKWSYP